jgi:tRNA U34 5-methylaminomethyl-2-thiouridine-forming methyltransferase MnmC
LVAGNHDQGSVSFVTTGDGSDTLFVKDLNEHYHSTFGAIQESRFIFIETGLAAVFRNPPAGKQSAFHILEAGFGTGLNALLSQIEAERRQTTIDYTAIEAFPLGSETWERLNYPRMTGAAGSSEVFVKIHRAGWNAREKITGHFFLEKMQTSLEQYIPEPECFDLVFFDAFGPEVQPHLWTREIFGHLFQGLRRGGMLVTYSVKGIVVRAMKEAGFDVEKLPGPPGKRHILRALKK